MTPFFEPSHCSFRRSLNFVSVCHYLIVHVGVMNAISTTRTRIRAHRLPTPRHMFRTGPVLILFRTSCPTQLLQQARDGDYELSPQRSGNPPPSTVLAVTVRSDLPLPTVSTPMPISRNRAHWWTPPSGYPTFPPQSAPVIIQSTKRRTH